MPENKVTIIVTTDASGAITGFKTAESQITGSIKKIETETETAFAKMKKHWLSLSAAAIAAFATIQQGWALMSRAASYQDQKAQLNALASSYSKTADSIISDIKRITNGMISMEDIVDTAVNTMAKGLRPEQLMELAKYADVVGDRMKTSAAEGFRALAEAAALGREKTLENIVGIIDLEAALGDKLKTMTEAEKATARYNIMLERLRDRYPDVENAVESFGDKMERLTATVRDLELFIGSLTIRLASGFLAVLNAVGLTLAKTAQTLIAPFAIIELGLNKLGISTVTYFQNAHTALEKWSKELRDGVVDNFSAMIASSENLAGAMGNIKGATEAIKLKGLADDWEKTKKKLEADIEKRNLDEYQKKLIDIRLEYEALIKKFGKKPEIETWFTKMTEQVNLEKAQAEYNKIREAALKAYEAREQLEEKLTEVIGTETQKREIQYRKQTRELIDLAFESAQDMEELEKRLTQIQLAEMALREQARVKDMQQERKDFKETIQLYIQEYEEATNIAREFGETELEYTKRVITAKEKNIAVLKEFIKDLEEAGMAGEDVYKKIIALVKELEIEQRRLNATFEEGVDYALREYSQGFMDAFERGAQIARQTANEIEDALVTMFDNPKKAIDNLWNYFLMMLKRMAAQALAQPIIVPISTVMAGMFGQVGTAGLALGGGMLGGLGTLGGIGVGGLLGGLMGGSTGQLGGLLGAGLAAFVPSIGSAILTPIVSAFGTLSTTIGNFIVPVIGGLIGGLIGAIVGLFKKKKYPEMVLQFVAGGDASQYQPGKHWTGAGLGVEGGMIEFAYKNVGDWSKAAEQILQMFANVRAETMKALEGLGLDISGFFKDWKKWFPDLSGKTAEEIQQMLKDALGEYISFASGIDFKQWQKAGEDLVDTVSRIIATWQAFPKVVESFDDFIGAIEGSYDEIAKWKDDLLEAEENIKKLRKSLEQATDPTDALNYAQQLKQAIYEKYLAEKQLIEGLVQAIQALEAELIDFQISIRSKIASLTGDFSGLLSTLSNAMQTALDNMANAATAAGKLQFLKQYIGYLDQWVEANIQAIQAKYAAEQTAINAQINALNSQKAAINEQLRKLREQLQLARMWGNLLASVKKQILDMTVTAQSPRDVFERMHYLKSEMDRVRALWAGATGEDRAKYASELQALIQQYMGLAAEAFQRPSPEYQAIYDEMLKWLEAIKVDAEKYTKDEADILRQIESLEEQALAIDRQIQALQEQSVRLQEQMQAEIQAFQASVVQHYEWAETEGVRLYEETIKDMKDKLASIIGDKTVEQYLADLQLAAVTELVTIRDLLTQIAKKFEVPGFASGGYVTSKTLAWVGEKEPEYIIPQSQMRQGRSVTINIPVTVNGGSGSAGDIANATAAAIRRELKNILKYDNSVRQLVRA